MKLCKINQRTFGQLCDHYDVVVCSSGYESRARYVATQLAEKRVVSANRYVLAFKEHTQECARPDNDRGFEKLGFIPFACSGHSTAEVRACFESALIPVNGLKSARLLVDISCMTRAWYGEIVHALLSRTVSQELIVDFTYTLAEFVPPLGEYPPNRVAGPVPGFVGMALPDKPTTLGIGLGYHRDRAIGLKDYLDPKLTVLFYSDPALEPKYVESVRITNEQILNEVSENNVIAYPVSDCVMTFSILNSFCEGMMKTSRVVLCSLGPKIFGLCCFLVAAVHRDISIWRVGAGDHETPFDHKPTGTPLLLETLWSPGD
jgi:hypothetical protein